ncbi:hypothetical protein Dsin_012235 [Dipteronia sinensis]|uniref:Uncharacterized protein n=1 Tax=Dipteronia sinensis TaxID=43782 RepID=A0AAE0AII0_9ROSI|nr:hypothetical protein Dsin_012235 [Dipteronia sinensis]
MGKPRRIRGRLSILVLQNVSDSEDAGNARLKDKKDIKEYGKVSKSFEFYGKPVAPFEFLCILKFVNIPNWEFGEPSGVTEGQFPVLQEPHLKKYEELIRKLPGSLPLLVKLHIAECSKLEFLINETASTHLYNMVSLTSLKNIGGCKNLKLFPDEGLLPASLTSLLIIEFSKLETLNLNGLQLNSSLEKMEINTCANLCSMSTRSLPSTLSSLEITRCSLLIERCCREEDWSKISHIQNKVINGELV